MQILEMSREFEPMEIYLMTKSASIKSVKDIEDGDTFTPTGYLVYTDTNSKGEENTMLSLIDADNHVWCCQSETFKREFLEILEIFKGNFDFTIKKISGTSKNKRDFVTCDLVF